MDSATITEYPPVTITTRKMLDQVNKLRNAEVAKSSATNNTVVLFRTDHYLELKEKRLDGFEQLSNLVEASNLVIGDDFNE